MEEKTNAAVGGRIIKLSSLRWLLSQTRGANIHNFFSVKMVSSFKKIYLCSFSVVATRKSSVNYHNDDKKAQVYLSTCLLSSVFYTAVSHTKVVKKKFPPRRTRQIYCSRTSFPLLCVCVCVYLSAIILVFVRRNFCN